MTRLRHWWLAVTTLLPLIFKPRLRSLLAEMRAFCRSLPAALKQPLPQALLSLTPDVSRLPLAESKQSTAERTTRNLADIAALLDRRSPLGLCLRRSLTRYHYLRRIGVPVVLHFGAKFVAGKPDREVAGHAWLTLDGEPYFETDENWRGFATMLSYSGSTLTADHQSPISNLQSLTSNLQPPTSNLQPPTSNLQPHVRPRRPYQPRSPARRSRTRQ